jgi:hypothetical protein
MSQNNELYQACKAWLEGALHLLTTVPTPYEPDFQVTFTETGYGAHGVPKIGITQLYILYRNLLFRLPEYDHLIEIITTTPALASVLWADTAGNVLPDPDQQRHSLERYFATLLTEYLTTNSSFSFSVDTFNHIYDATTMLPCAVAQGGADLLELKQEF